MQIKIYGKDNCEYCDQAKAVCEMVKAPFVYKRLDHDYSSEELIALAPKLKTYPAVFIDDDYIGGFTELAERLV